ncbi:hypothetical protein Tco_0662970 [Tanacetum coccineum]
MTSLQSLIKQHNERTGTAITTIRLTFGDDTEVNKEKEIERNLEGVKDGDLQKPFKEVLRSPFTRRIIKFSAPKHSLPTNMKIYDGSTDPDDHISRFAGAANQGEWIRCFKDPSIISKIARRANETLPAFKERWTDETSFIHDVPKVMRIYAFMSNSKCPELVRHFSDQVPRIMTKMMRRVDDFVKSEEAFRTTELLKGEYPNKGQKHRHQNDWPSPYVHGWDRSRHNYRNDNRRAAPFNPYVPPRPEPRRQDVRRYDSTRPGLESLTKFPKEILAMEPQLWYLCAHRRLGFLEEKIWTDIVTTMGKSVTPRQGGNTRRNENEYHHNT